jgi:hypothetical protein
MDREKSHMKSKAENTYSTEEWNGLTLQERRRIRKADSNRKWRLNNTEEHKMRHRVRDNDWKQKNADSLPARRKVHYAANTEAILARGREYKSRETSQIRRREIKKQKDANFFVMFGLGLGL